MKKEDFRQWLTERVATQRRLTMAAVGFMAILGLFAFFIEALVIRWIIKTGFVGSSFLSGAITLGILGAVLFATWLRIPKNLADSPHDTEIDGEKVTILVAPPMGVVWTFALGSIDSDRSWVERLLGLLAMPQRLLCTAWYTAARLKRLQDLNIAGCAAVLRVLFRKGERAEISDITEKLTKTDIPQGLRDASLIDGVVFLTRRTFGVSLAPRLVEDLTAWRNRRGATDDFDD